jgi:hypothetical protein
MTVLSQKTYSGSLKTSRLRRKTHVHWRRPTWRNRASPGHSAIIGSDIKTLCAHGNEDRASSAARGYVIRKETSCYIGRSCFDHCVSGSSVRVWGNCCRGGRDREVPLLPLCGHLPHHVGAGHEGAPVGLMAPPAEDLTRARRVAGRMILGCRRRHHEGSNYTGVARDGIRTPAKPWSSSPRHVQT